MIQVFDTGRAFSDARPYTDDWGTFISGYAPIFDHSGKMCGIIGVDMAATEYVRRLSMLQTAAWAALAVSAGLGIIVGRLTGTVIAARDEREERTAERSHDLAIANANLLREAEERERAVIALRASEEHLSHQAFHDALTDLPNRALFRDRLQTALARSKSRDRSIAVAFSRYR